MPLTNPNKVVTEERLSEFYGQILPYMGGMPDVLANKFSKGDLYSTDEKMIGVWTDGKPLYQKSYVVENLVINTINFYDIAVFDSTINPLNYFGVIKRPSDNATFALNTVNAVGTTNNSIGTFFYSPNKLGARVGSGEYGTYSFYFTVQYTKTTDSPIAIGSDTDYSTTEKIVGTWIDGSPVWQKTVATGGNVPSGATLILRTAMASTGYDTILYTK